MFIISRLLCVVARGAIFLICCFIVVCACYLFDDQCCHISCSVPIYSDEFRIFLHIFVVANDTKMLIVVFHQLCLAVLLVYLYKMSYVFRQHVICIIYLMSYCLSVFVICFTAAVLSFIAAVLLLVVVIVVCVVIAAVLVLVLSFVLSFVFLLLLSFCLFCGLTFCLIVCLVGCHIFCPIVLAVCVCARANVCG